MSYFSKVFTIFDHLKISLYSTFDFICTCWLSSGGLVSGRTFKNLLWYHDFFLFKKKSYCRIIALQYCADFCHTSTWISHRCTFVPSLLNLPPISHAIPPLWVVTETWVELPVLYSKKKKMFLLYSKLLLAIYYIYGNVCFHATFSVHLTLSFSHSAHMSVLFICPTNTFISTIFLDSMYVH